MSDPAWVPYVISGACILGGGFLLYRGQVSHRKYRIIRDTPRSKIRSLAMGIVEIHGQVKTYRDNTIRTPFSKTDCVYFKYVIEEYRKRTTSDGKGKRRTTYQWEKIAGGESGIPFMASDETGEVYVNPAGSETYIERHKVFYQHGAGIFGGIDGIRGLISSLTNRDGKDSSTPIKADELGLESVADISLFSMAKVGDRRYYEYFIIPGDNLFVLGTAAPNPDVPENILIQKGINETTFIISDRAEKGVLKTLKKAIIISMIFGGLLFIAGVMVMFYVIGVV